MRKMIGLFICIFLMCSFISVYAEQTGYLSPEEVYADGEAVYITDATRHSIHVIAGDQVTEILLSAAPTGITGDDLSLYVTMGGFNGKVAIIDKATLTVSEFSTDSHTPTSPLVQGNLLYVANRFSFSVSMIDLTTKTVTQTVAVTREPTALVMAGGKLFVGNLLPGDAATDAVVSSVIDVLDPMTLKKTDTIRLPNGTSGIRDMATDGVYLYVPHLVARYAYPTTQVDRGWVNTNALSVISVGECSVKATVLLDDIEIGAANPWGVTVFEDTIAVTLNGVHQACLISKGALMDKIYSTENPETIVDNLAFLSGIKTTVALPGNGPRGVAYANGALYMPLYFSGNVAKYVPATGETTSISIGTQKEADAIRKGEQYWYDGTLCFQQWQSCNSCHPDARVDGFNWDNMNDGIGTSRNTKSMLLSHATPPVMITGIRADAQTAVAAGMKYIQFNTMVPEDLNCIDAYLMNLTPEVSPYRKQGQLTQSALRGKALFNGKASCYICHPEGTHFTDMRLHNVKTNTEPESYWEDGAPRRFDTPTLVELWRTGPYFADGRAKTIKEALTTAAPNTVHDGYFLGLNESEIDDLVNYVASISGNPDEAFYDYAFTKLGESTVTVKRTGNTYQGNALLIEASYAEDGRLIKVVSTPILLSNVGDTEEYTLSGNVNDNHFRLFIWEDVASGQPYTRPKES